METFSGLLALYAGNSPVTGKFPSQRPVTWSFDVFFDLRLNKRLSKQSRRWWFEMPWCSLGCHCNAYLSNGVGPSVGSHTTVFKLVLAINQFEWSMILTQSITVSHEISLAIQWPMKSHEIFWDFEIWYTRCSWSQAKNDASLCQDKQDWWSIASMF